jgi:acetylornithine deacetylase/succinyl-diaminopimelate desuccinylase-like protein
MYHQAISLQAFLQDLVRIRSVNGRDRELEIAERVRDEAQRLGFEATLAGSDPERPNVIVEWGHGPRGFALVGHLDTVAEGEASAWRYPPFGAEIAAGRMYGRGTADNKAGIACGLHSLVQLREAGVLNPDRHRVILAGVADEESGATSTIGVRYLLDHGYLPVQAAIYTYASDIVCIGHRGLLRLVLTSKGQAIHSGSEAWSRGEGGVNAVTGLAAILLGLESLSLDEPQSAVSGGVDLLTTTITPGTLMSGGEFESMVPANAQALVDIRTPPGQDQQRILQAVADLIGSEVERRTGLTVEVEVKNQLPGAQIAGDHRLAQIAQRQARAHIPGEWPIAITGPANEGYMLIEAGIATLPGFGPTGGGAHAPDEWIEITSLEKTVAMYSAIINEWLLEGESQ